MNLKILVAEDDAISRKLMSMIIKPYGNDVLMAENGEEAVELARGNPDIDLILMDMQMPMMDGIEAAKEIRKFNPDAIIIAQTAFALQGDKERIIDAGCTDYISKPVKRDDLAAIINKYFG